MNTKIDDFDRIEMGETLPPQIKMRDLQWFAELLRETLRAMAKECAAVMTSPQARRFIRTLKHVKRPSRRVRKAQKMAAKAAAKTS